ncbi:MAG: type II toxin-antitoxin system HicB family antitoxin [Roseburia sp.]|nr:type II toxin-antitoxin system HicB family antitoxin [Roseburia sp.]
MSNEKKAYQVILSPEEDGSYFVTVPDMDIQTQGESIADAMDMARDAIGLKGITLQDMGKDVPEPGAVRFEAEKNDILTYVDINFSDYRKKADNRAVKKNCTIPYWMSVEAENAGVNYSKLLQEAIISALGLKARV